MSVCPRCQRPLEDEEPYVCCAGVELRWRCTSCHKVAEGFAFPYGLCPYCKGTLELLDRGAIEGDQAMEAIRKAFEIELGGHAFYERASRDATEPQLRELFARFAAMEQEHMQTLSKRYHATMPTPSEDFQIDARRSSPASTASRRTRQPVRIAIAFEQRAVDFFSREGETAPPDRSNASCTASSPPKSASTSRC
jgi:rubrerythrin